MEFCHGSMVAYIKEGGRVIDQIVKEMLWK